MIQTVRIRMRMKKLSLPRHSRVGAANVGSLVTRQCNARVKPIRRPRIQVTAEMGEQSTV